MSWIDKTAVIGHNVEIGKDVIIGPYCVIGTPAEHPREPFQVHGKVIIGDGARLYKLVTVDAPLSDEGITEVGKGCVLMAHSHVGHDAKLGEGVTLSTGAKIGGHSVIGKHSTVGLNATTHQRTVLAEGTMVGAQSFIKGNRETPYRIFVGAPAKDIGENAFLLQRLKDEGLLDAPDLSTGQAKK
jgi:UDP-N-acetylglucosamine acyltransferase